MTTADEYISYDTFSSGCYFWNKPSNNVETRSQVRLLIEFPVVLLHQYSVAGLLLYYVFGLCVLRIATTHIYQRRTIVHFCICFLVFIYHTGAYHKMSFLVCFLHCGHFIIRIKKRFKLPVWPENMVSMLHVLHIIAYNPYRILLHVTLMFQAAQIYVLTSNTCARI